MHSLILAVKQFTRRPPQNCVQSSSSVVSTAKIGNIKIKSVSGLGRGGLRITRYV